MTQLLEKDVINGKVFPRASFQRACSDCEEYEIEDRMTTTPAGNMICRRCAKRRTRLAADRAQLSMFGQNSMF